MTQHPLDHLRTLLDHFNDSDRSEVLLFFQLVAQLGEEMVEELGQRITKSMTPRGLRLVLMEACFYYPFPEWVPHLAKTLRHEADLDVFTSGVRALGRIQGPPALKVLRELYAIRPAEAFQAVLSQVLAECDPREAFSYHLGRLLEGSANTRVANEAAQELGRIVSAEDLPQLLVVVHHEDLLIARHALRLVTLIKAPEAAEFLLMFLQECHHEMLGDRRLKDLLGLIKANPSNLLAETLIMVADAFQEVAPLAVQQVQDESIRTSAQGLQIFQQLRDESRGSYETFLVECLYLVSEGKAAKLSSMVLEAQEGMHQRGRRLGFSVDTCAEGLLGMLRSEKIVLDRVLPVLAESYYEGTGREGLARAFGTLVPHDDEDMLDILLTAGDSTCRGAALDALGERKREELLPALMRACRDPIVDLQQRAMVALGHLGGTLGQVLKLVLSGVPDDIRLGLRIAKTNALHGAVDVILGFLTKNDREELSIEAAEALGAIGDVHAADALMDLLHSGQSARMQVALAQALATMGHPDLALSLCTKAAQIKQVSIHAIALEALVGAYGTPEHPFGAGVVRAFREQLLAVWNDKEPWPIRFRMLSVFERLQGAPPELYEEIMGLVQAALGDKRCHSNWSMEQQNAAQVLLKELSRKGAESRQRG